MRQYIKNSLLALCTAFAVSTSSCIDEVQPTTEATPDQIQSSASSLQSMVNALPAFFVTFNTYGTDANSNDWGYPCQMFLREIMGQDFPIYQNNYNYWRTTENGTAVTTHKYTFVYYYKFIKSANNVISTIDEDNATDAQKEALGQALGYRALCYLDLYRLFEFKPTGYSSLDNEAQSRNILGLTVSIVTEKTTLDELKNNPRVPFYTMYRFILTDLNKAEKYLSGYSRSVRSMMDESVIYGLKARLYLEMASRFDNDASALSQALAAEGTDEYDDLGVKSAADCYAKVIEYADKAIVGYTPMTESQWTDPTTGFNTVQPSWLLSAIASSTEQVNIRWYWCAFLTQISSEATWSMGQYGNAYRCISSGLYNQISDSDWRKMSWVAPGDTGSDVTEIPSQYKTLLTLDKWNKIGAYANIKFRAGGGELENSDEGMVCALPLMRVEEMYFDKFEAMAHTQSVSAAANALQSFINTYRYTDDSYRCTATDIDTFVDDLMLQRRIEFWGEGLNYFDYKRLNLPITRTYDGSNYLTAFRLNSKAGYTAPWMNLFIPESETNMNAASIPNPDPSGVVAAQ